MNIPPAAEIDKELSRRSFYEFVKMAWPVLEPETEFKDGWHVQAICDHLQALADGSIKRLIINIPPGCTKSILSCVMWPAWLWTDRPATRFLTGSHSQTYSTRDALKSRRLLTSDWYQQRWGGIFVMTGDQNQKTRYENDKTGFRAAISVGTGTGDRAGIRILDDPLNADYANSRAQIDSTNEWLRNTWATRGSDPEKDCELLIMQRLHEQDPTGFSLAEFGGYEHLMLPMRFEIDRRCKTSIFIDPRKTDGELLAPDRFSEQTVKDLERKMGSYLSAGQLQQKPAPREGGIVKTAWLKYYQIAPLEFDEIIQAWDLTFKGGAKNDYVVGGVFGRKGADVYLLDLIRDKLDASGQMKAIASLSSKWPEAGAKFVEEAANGAAVISLLKDKIPGLIPITPKELGGDKEARLGSVVPFIEAGNLWLPAKAEWLNDYVAELTTFPSATYDDQVDVTSMALIKMLLNNHMSKFLALEF